MLNYNLSDTRIILGDMENALCINTMILSTKKILYDAMKKEQKPHIAQVKNDVKKIISKRNIDTTYKERVGCLINSISY